MTTEKFCFCLKLETGCLLLGFTTFLLSVVQSTLVFLKMNGYFDLEGPGTMTEQHRSNMTNQRHAFNLTLSRSAEEVMLAFAVIVLFLWMLFSVLMIIGIFKKKVSFVMTYFLYGIAVSILYMLFGLLQAIGGRWPVSLVTIIPSLLYIRCLASVYAAYDEMRQEKCLDLEQLISDDDPMVEC